MSEDKPFAVPAPGVRAIIDEVESFGHQNLETGGFLMMGRGESTASAVAVAGTSGIVRRHNLLQISARALDRLFTHAAERDLWIPVQFHSHGISAFLSEPDEAHGLCVEGFVSTVIPHFFEPSSDMSAWGWWQYSSGQWLDFEAAHEVSGEITLIRFDEDGVRAS